MRFLRYFALLMLGSIQLLAVPAWSRLTNSQCATCHATPTWQLNKTGLEFLKNGHRLEPVAFDKKDMKWDNYLSFVWKGRVWNDKTDGDARGQAQKASTQVEQHSFSIYTGGPISERLSFFTEMYLSEGTGSTSGGNVVQGDGARKKLAEAFLQYNLPLNDKTFLAIRGGEILPAALHVFGVGARSAEQRALVLNGSNVGTNPYKPFNRQQGLDLTLANPHYEIALGVLNGSANTNGIDADSHKDIFASAIWNMDSYESGLGVYHYKGKFTNYATAGDPSTAIDFQNDFNRTGLMGRFIRDNWRVVGAYFTGKETFKGAAAGTFIEPKNKGYYLLADYNVNDSFGLFARVDSFDPRDDKDDDQTREFLVGMNGLFFQSEKSAARWNVEYVDRVISKNSVGSRLAATTPLRDVKESQLRFQFTWAF